MSKYIGKRIILVLLGLSLAFILFGPPCFVKYRKSAITKMDCESIRADARTIMATHHVGNLEESKDIPYAMWPQAIRSLDPIYVILRKDCLHIIVSGLPMRIQMVAFPEGAKQFGDKRIIDGLWFSLDVYKEQSNK